MTEKRPPPPLRQVAFANLYGFFRSFVERDTSGLTLLDFGCGYSGYVNLYSEHFSRSLALDVVDYAHEYEDKNVEFILSDGRCIALPDRSVDVVVSHSALEHVQDIHHTMDEINRVLVEGGYAYLTVSPLYFSPGGGHIKTAPGAERLADWEHLDPDSPHYLGVDDGPIPINRRYILNKLTSATFLASVGRQPWDIVTYKLSAHFDKPLPDFLRADTLHRVDLYTKEFRLIAKKNFSMVGDEIVPPNPKSGGPAATG